MTDFLAAVGLVFVIEGLIFAAFPGAARRSMAAVMGTADQTLRIIGLGCAIFGLLLVWLVRS